MKAAQKISTYQLHSEKHPGFTMFPTSKMPLSTQFQFHHTAPEIHNSDLYEED